MISESEFKGWLQEEMTMEFFLFLAKEEHAHRMVVAEGLSLTEGSNEEIVRNLLTHLNKADVYNLLQNIQYEDLLDEKDEEGTDSPLGAQATN